MNLFLGWPPFLYYWRHPGPRHRARMSPHRRNRIASRLPWKERLERSGALQILVWFCNKTTKFAFELILTGDNWDAGRAMAAGLINRVVPHDALQDAAWKWADEIGRFDKVTLKFCKMAAHSSMEAASVPLAAEIAWLMQEEHALVNPRAYAGTKEFHK